MIGLCIVIGGRWVGATRHFVAAVKKLLDALFGHPPFAQLGFSDILIILQGSAIGVVRDGVGRGLSGELLQWTGHDLGQ